ncbi:MAG TPA: adenylate/guanylate cyclase domain-containing protein [Terriglobia bacterium]|nr:adenylate/guanylate cyclase domain-containing protein [Terriglobia bacterium]
MANSLPAALKKRIPAVLALVLTLAFAWLAINRLDLSDGSFLTSLEMRWLDAKFSVRGARPAGSDVVIVGLDDKTLDQLGSGRVFQRSNFATLVSKLAAAGPKVIGFDIAFDDKDVSDETNDQKFSDAIRSANRVVLGLIVTLEKTQGPKRLVDELDEGMKELINNEKQIFAVENHPPGGAPDANFYLASKVKRNLPVLTKAAVSFGFANFDVNAEGRLRYQPQVIEYGGRLYPSLDLQMLRQYLNSPGSILVNYQDNGHISDIQVGSYSIPTDDFGRVMIDYSGPGGTYQTVSMIDVMEGRTGPEAFKDKIVLIGAPTVGLNDVVATPFDPVLPGVELHANYIDNVLHGRFLYRDKLAKIIDLAIIVLFGLIAALLLPRLNASRSVVYTSLILAGFAALNYWAFLRLHWVLSFIYPFLSLVVTSGTLISYKYLTEERERKRTKSTFQYYLDPHVVDQVVEQPEKLRLGGEKREMTVLFSDIRGFTSFSEKMAPTEVVQFLNQYFNKMQGIIFRNKGTLDKLIGDAVMCFWNHPLDIKDHAVRGVITALEMVKAVDELRGVLVLPGGAKFEIGIGVNTGPMVVGNMGSETRLSYTIMGDNVNLGSRLESLNKFYGTKILVSDTTFHAIQDMVLCRELDTIQVKGKSQAVTIYEPIGLKRLEFERRKTDRRGPMTATKQVKKALVLLFRGDRRQEERRLGSDEILARPDQEELATMYEHALALYRKGDFDAAEMGFDHVLTLRPGDGPSRLMKTRIAKFRTEYAGHEAHFDPVYKFDEK